MVKFVEVDPSEINTERLGRRGRVSYPLLKGFLEADIKMAKLDLTGLVKNPNYLRSVLYSYIRSHKLPVKIFSAQGEMYLMRLDMDASGVVDPNWKPQEDEASEGSKALQRDETPVPISAAEVAERFNKEKGQITK